MSKILKSNKRVSSKKAYSHIKTYKGVSEYRLNNGLTVLYKNIPDTGVVTTNITYKVGARDEGRGYTGLAHMLEHMLFKPTKSDIARKIDSGAMQFEREIGVILNATTWKDRTTYYFSYPKEYFLRALQIEAERMHDVVITDKEFQPERANVLSEFDMHFGDPYFALSVEMVCSAYHSHPYGHETIGFREDIERYTVEMLQEFYKKYYDPQNATLMVIGDIQENEALDEVAKVFSSLSTLGSLKRTLSVAEPKQEGLRRVYIERPSQSQIVTFGVKHAGFPSKDWYITGLLSEILAGGPESILYKRIVDKGLASKVEMMVEPTSEENLALLFVTLSKKTTHAEIEKIVFQAIKEITPKNIALLYKKVQQKVRTDEIIGRSSSLRIAMELTEYVAASAWEKFFDTEMMLSEITAKDIAHEAHKLFDHRTMTIGHFIGK